MNHLRTLRQERGFTLIELLVVIVVIGILIGLAVPAVTSFLEQGRDTDRKADLGSLETPLEEFYTNNGYYPDVGDASELNSTDVDGLNIEEPPEDPQGGAYGYNTSGCEDVDGENQCQGYELVATLENEDDQDGEERDGDVVYTVTSSQSAFEPNGNGGNGE